MNMLSLNCRGLGTPRSGRDLHQMVKEMHPRFVFLMETLSSKFRMEWLRVKLGFAGFLWWSRLGEVGVWPCFGRRKRRLKFIISHVDILMQLLRMELVVVDGSLQAFMAIR